MAPRRRSDRPLAQDEAAFRTLYAQRQPMYHDVADARTSEGRRRPRRRWRPRRAGRARAAGRARPRRRPGRARRDAHVAGIHGWTPSSRSAPAAASHELAPGEEAKRSSRSRRSGTSSGSTRGTSSRSAAVHDRRRRVRGRDLPARDRLGRGADDARRPGRCGDRRQDSDRPPGGKNLVGAFHWPVRTVIDLRRSRHSAGRAAEGAGRGRQDRPARGRADLGAARTSRCVAAQRSRPRSACATRTSAASGRCSISATRSPTRSRRPPATSSARRRGGARAARRAPALRPRRPTAVEETLAAAAGARRPRRAWAALPRDKKATAERSRLVLLEAPGRPASASSCPRPRCARALDALIAG